MAVNHEIAADMIAIPAPSPIAESTQLKPATAPSLNDLILDAINAMPSGGKYGANAQTIGTLRDAIRLEQNRLLFDFKLAQPSFCSSATYLVFLSVIDRLQHEGKIELQPSVLDRFLVNDQPDGIGVWGRWNANGPGTARFFCEIGAGRNFTALDQAKPGDFLKIFWSEEIGVREFGHSVIYMGSGHGPRGEKVIRFWSSNQPNGYGEAEVPLSKVKRMLFSRFEHPEALSRVLRLPAKDQYLADLIRRAGTVNEMLRAVDSK